jgi:hypothetical protein
MNLSYDLEVAADIFAHADEEDSAAPNYAFEMNQKHPCYAQAMKALEASGLEGFAVDYLMESLLTVWHALAHSNRIKITPAKPQDIKRNFENFLAFNKYYNGEKISQEKAQLRFFRCAELETFTVLRLNQVYPDIRRCPPQVLGIFFALMKTFDEAIFAHQSKRKLK